MAVRGGLECLAPMGSHPRSRATNAHVDGLNPDDPGIRLLADAVADQPAREILLVCCGDIPGVGSEANRLVLDVREHDRAIARTLPVDLLGDAATPADNVIVWPRPHLGKDFTRWCLARGASSLRPGGALWCAARKAKGALGLTDEIGRMMGEVDVVGRSRGYRLMRGRRGPAFDDSYAREVLATRYTIEDPALPGLVLHSAPGVFSRRELDGGTRQLIEHAAAHAPPPSTVLDLGCGIGPLALWAATRWTDARVLAVDSNVLAVALARDNASRHGLQPRVVVEASDGMPTPPTARARAFEGAVDLALVNPPTHADPETLRRFADDLKRWLRPGGLAMLVVNRGGRMTQQLAASGARVEAHAYARFTILHATW